MNQKRKENMSQQNYYKVDLQERGIMNKQISVIQRDKEEESFKTATLKDSLHVDQQEDRAEVHQEAIEEELVVDFRDLRSLSPKKDLIIKTLTDPQHTHSHKLRNLMNRPR
jgi:hypothetical protein